MAEYRLSQAADRDLGEILRFGFDRFGPRQTTDYVDRLMDRLQRIADEPALFAATDHIAPGSRRCVFGAHSIYFRVTEAGILVLRILGRQDTAAAFGS